MSAWDAGFFDCDEELLNTPPPPQKAGKLNAEDKIKVAHKMAKRPGMKRMNASTNIRRKLDLTELSGIDLCEVRVSNGLIYNPVLRMPQPARRAPIVNLVKMAEKELKEKKDREEQAEREAENFFREALRPDEDEEIDQTKLVWDPEKKVYLY